MVRYVLRCKSKSKLSKTQNNGKLIDQKNFGYLRNSTIDHGLLIVEESIFFLRPFCANNKPHLSFQLCNSLLEEGLDACKWACCSPDLLRKPSVGLIQLLKFQSVQVIDYTCEEGHFPVSTSCVPMSNPDLLSSSETGVYP